MKKNALFLNDGSNFLQTGTESFKVLMVGDDNVGKSCIVNRFTINQFRENEEDFNYKEKIVEMERQRVRLQICDICCKQRTRMMSGSYYKGCDGVVVVYDVTDKQSFESVKGWLKDILFYAPRNVCKILVGNKVDLIVNKVVSTEEAISLAQQENCLFIESSAKSHTSISSIFMDLTSSMILSQLEEDDSQIVENDEKKGRQSCCAII
ncbi:Ras-likeGTP-binding protein YPT1 [Entamoeba marina]